MWHLPKIGHIRPYCLFQINCVPQCFQLLYHRMDGVCTHTLWGCQCMHVPLHHHKILMFVVSYISSIWSGGLGVATITQVLWIHCYYCVLLRSTTWRYGCMDVWMYVKLHVCMYVLVASYCYTNRTYCSAKVPNESLTSWTFTSLQITK